MRTKDLLIGVAIGLAIGFLAYRACSSRFTVIHLNNMGFVRLNTWTGDIHFANGDEWIEMQPLK